MVLVRQSCAGSDWQSHVEKNSFGFFFFDLDIRKSCAGSDL